MSSLPDPPEKADPALPPAEYLANELQVHRAELEHQNRELRDAQLSIETSRQRYFALFDQAPVGYFTFGDRHTLLDVNAAGVALMGRSRADLGQLPFSYFLTEESRPAFHALVAGALKGTGGSDLMELGATLPEGRHRRLMVRAVRLEQSAGKPATVLLAGFDVTGLREAERREHDLAERLRESRHLESLGRLAGGIAHDFNNLLQVISASLELLADEAQVEDRPDSIRAARSAIERASLLTRQVMSYSRRTPVSPVAIAVADLLRNMGPVLRSFMHGQARLLIESDPDTPGVIADTAQLEQVVLNLVVNAADAVGTAGSVRIRTSRDRLPRPAGAAAVGEAEEQALLLEVTDTGIGMSPETKARIFEPFFTTKPPGRGTGLGLSLVQSIVTRHGGAIDVESRPGAGTTFRIRFPAADGAPVHPVVVPKVETTSVDCAVVLLAEDDPVLRRVTQRLLRRRGIEVIEAVDGADAVEKFNEHAAAGIDLLMFDVSMPRLNGTDAYDVIRPHPACPPVLFVSGVPEDAPSGGSARVRFLRKPYTEAELLSAIAVLRDEATR